MAKEISEYSRTSDDGIGRFGEMPMDAQITEASDISGIVECVSKLPSPSESVYQLDRVYQLMAVHPPYVVGRFYKCLNRNGYVMCDVSEIQTESYDASEHDFFHIEGNTLNLHWAADNHSSSPFIKTEIQLVYLNADGSMRSTKTIFTEPVKNSYVDGVSVIVDNYTADGIVKGRIALRMLSTYIGKVYTCNLTKIP